MKRLAIYLTYDSQKIVDNYIGYMLCELKPSIDYLVVVVNQLDLQQGLDILENYADEILFRENIGYDAGGYKDALCNYIGWDKVFRYDELVLINDSFYGPFYPMKTIFNEMEKKEADFWGLIRHGPSENCAEHIQSFFITIRSELLHNIKFRDYWESMPYYKNLREVIKNHEMKFTRYFADMGFTYDTYADDAANISTNNVLNYNQYVMIPYELIKKRKFPFVKKSMICSNQLSKRSQECWQQIIDYIEKETLYETGLIWDNLLRTRNVADIYQAFCLQYIVSATKEKYNKKIAIAVFISQENSFEDVYEYIMPIREAYSVFIYTASEELLRQYRENGFESICYNINTIGDYLAALGEYEYVLLIHDCDFEPVNTPNYVPKSYFYNIWTNLFNSEKYINGVINIFEKNNRLGCLLPPKSNFGKYFGAYGWNGNYGDVKNMLNQKEINCIISENKPPIIITENLWIRGDILRSISIKEIDTKLLPYVWTYLAQNAGFYSGVVQSADYAAMNEINQKGYLDSILYQMKNQIGLQIESFDDLSGWIFKIAADGFCNKHRKVYVYGVGQVMQKYIKYVSDFDAYIVSDGQPKADSMNGKKILYLSEVDFTNNEGIIICLDKENQSYVLPQIREMGIRNYLCV